MEVRFEVFRGTFASWDKLFAEAAEFASRIGPDRLIGISHSCDNNDGVVTVWYWFQILTKLFDLLRRKPLLENPAHQIWRHIKSVILAGNFLRGGKSKLKKR